MIKKKIESILKFEPKKPVKVGWDCDICGLTNIEQRQCPIDGATNPEGDENE